VSNNLLANHGRDSINAGKDNSPMRLINIIRQSSQESHTLSRRDDSVLTRLGDNKLSNSSTRQIGYFHKDKAHHRLISSRKNSSRLQHSQTRVLRSSQNEIITKKLYVKIKDLRDDFKMSKY
jgi:hypothetical protein